MKTIGIGTRSISCIHLIGTDVVACIHVEALLISECLQNIKNQIDVNMNVNEIL